MDAALEAERLGFESVWVSEHLVLPVEMTGSPEGPDRAPPIPSSKPEHDVFGFLAYLAGRTAHVRLGTNVYNIGLRHPFVTARAVATLDIVSGGRVELGVGISWLREEWDAVGLDFATRGRRADEAIAVCRRLWSEPVVEHHGEHFDFRAVMFEPKPRQQPSPPVVVGGRSDAALRRAARIGDGWISAQHTPDTIRAPLTRLHDLRDEHERADDARRFEVTANGAVGSADELERWRATGIHRLIVSPWSDADDTLDGLRRVAELAGLEAGAT